MPLVAMVAECHLDVGVRGTHRGWVRTLRLVTGLFGTSGQKYGRQNSRTPTWEFSKQWHTDIEYADS
ncbi:hypothetical protein RERY_40860 [Rhodococcus erythropolis]|nr:hypothetical protein [Rhodococcus erythropolis]OFV75238.1 hypothetical protein RERY_40860 [Rhodococcus erythropolis]